MQNNMEVLNNTSAIKQSSNSRTWTAAFYLEVFFNHKHLKSEDQLPEKSHQNWGNSFITNY